MVSKIKPFFNRFIERLVKPFASKVNPNVITVCGLLLSLLPALLVARGLFLYGSLSFAVFLVDILDGAIARVTGRITVFGGYLDAVCDRISDGIIFIGLAASGAAHPLLCGFALLTASLVSYAKSKGETALAVQNLGTNILAIGYAERAERIIILMISTLVFSFYKPEFFGWNVIEIGLIILNVLCIVTIGMRIRKVYQTLQNTEVKDY